MPQEVTVFWPEGGESDEEPIVFLGHLSPDRILAEANELGGVGSGGYAGCALAKQENGGWLVTYAREAPWDVEPYGIEGHRVLFDLQGSLSYIVRHSTAG